MRAGSATVLSVICLLLASCGPAEQVQVRPVKAVRVHRQTASLIAYGAGEIRARYDATLGFLVGGRIIERSADVGKRVKAGDVLARLDDQVQRANVTSAQASLTGSIASQTEAASAARRQENLLKEGAGTRQTADLAVATLATATANVQMARANLDNAHQQLSYTQLHASSDGVVTAVGADVGQVVEVGRMVVEVAQPGEREAVFTIGESAAALAAARPGIPVLVRLTSNPKISVTGHIRYVSPGADPQTRTYEARIALPNAPAEMALGTTVSGSISPQGTSLAIFIPLGALFHRGQTPAVWRFDTKTGAVKLVNVRVLRYDDNAALLSFGIRDGDFVVTAGVNSLYNGEHVRLLDAAAP